MKEKFGDWKIVHLKYPLRTTKYLSQKIKNMAAFVPSGLELHGLANEYNSYLDLSANMPIGPNIWEITRYQGNYYRNYVERLRSAFTQFRLPALIILNVNNMEPEEEDQLIYTGYFEKLRHAKGFKV